jgi:hypothetical protein
MGPGSLTDGGFIFFRGALAFVNSGFTRPGLDFFSASACAISTRSRMVGAVFLIRGLAFGDSSAGDSSAKTNSPLDLNKPTL